MAFRLRWFLVAITALASSACALEALAADEAVVIELVGTYNGVAELRVKNLSQQIVTYYHWFSLDKSPVPYCSNSDGSVYICASKVLVDGNGDPLTHVQYLKPGESVRFHARIDKAAAVGIKVVLDGKERYVWHSIRHNA